MPERKWLFGLSPDRLCDASKRFKSDQVIANYLGCRVYDLRRWRDNGEVPIVSVQRRLDAWLKILQKENRPYVREELPMAAPIRFDDSKRKLKLPKKIKPSEKQVGKGPLLGAGMVAPSAINRLQRARGKRRGPGRPSNEWKLISAKEIRAFRLSKGLYQKDLAKLLGTTTSAVSNWERDARAAPMHIQRVLRDYIDKERGGD